MKKRCRQKPPDPTIHAYEPRFVDLSHTGQVALAAWAVLLKSDPPEDGTRIAVPPRRFARAAGDISATVGLRSRKQENYPPAQRHRRRVRRTVAVTA